MSQNTEDDAVIQFSIRLAEALGAKVEDHNEICSSNEASLHQVTMVYKYAAKTFPQEALGEIGINKWSLARVNMYLRMKCGNIIQNESNSNKPQTKIEMSSLIFEGSISKRIDTFLDATQDWLPNEEDFSLAQEDVLKYDLNYDFENLDEIYLADREKTKGLSFYYE
jgi:hypothetical protein